MLAVISGMAAGFLHVLTGPDHLAAIAPLAVHEPRRPWRAGVRWGLGHSAGLTHVAALVLVLRELLPVDPISSVSERLVGVLLIGLGIWSAWQALRLRVHAHTHEHDGSRHAHLHLHFPRPPKPVEAAHAGVRHRHTHAAFGIGALHGLAGSSHFLGVLPALAFPSRLDSVAYLAAFAFGTVAAMAGFSSALGFLTTRWGGGVERNYRGLMGVCSAMAMAIGGWWLVSGG
jgi:hypothetical protein